MRSRTILYLTLFLAIAGIAGIFARAYFTDQTAEAKIEPEFTGPKVVVAERALDVGAFITVEDIRWQATADADEVILSQHFVEGAATLESLIGAVVRRKIGPDNPLTVAQIIKPGQRGFLAAVLRPGMRAVTVEIDKVSGNSGLTFPGDHVDLILTVDLEEKTRRAGKDLATETILSNVRVIAMGQRVEGFANIDAEPEDRPATTATLEVAPEFAERVHIAQELGRLALSLRSLADESAPKGEEIGGVIPTSDPLKLSDNLTRGADVSLALRLRELGSQGALAGDGEAPKAPPPLVIMRGAERGLFDPYATVERRAPPAPTAATAAAAAAAATAAVMNKGPDT